MKKILLALSCSLLCTNAVISGYNPWGLTTDELDRAPSEDEATDELEKYTVQALTRAVLNFTDINTGKEANKEAPRFKKVDNNLY